MFFNGVPDIHPQALDWVFPGPDLELKKELPNLDPENVRDFQVFEGDKAVSVLKELVDHFLMRKFLGPFPP